MADQTECFWLARISYLNGYWISYTVPQAALPPTPLPKCGEPPKGGASPNRAVQAGFRPASPEARWQANGRYDQNNCTEAPWQERTDPESPQRGQQASWRRDSKNVWHASVEHDGHGEMPSCLLEGSWLSQVDRVLTLGLQGPSLASSPSAESSLAEML